MSFGDYEIAFLVSGLALSATALSPKTAPKERRIVVSVGVGMVAYSLFVSTRSSGGWFLPIQLLVIPALVVVKGLYDAYAHSAGRSTKVSLASEGAASALDQRLTVCQRCGAQFPPTASCPNLARH